MQPTATAQLASPTVYSLQRKARRSQDVTHDPSCDSGTPHRRHASQLRSDMRPWNRWHARTDAHAGAVQERDATPTNIFARAGVQRRPALACSPRASGSYTGAGIQRTQQSLSNGQRPGYYHPPACPRTAHWRGCGGCGCPQGVCAYQGGATWGAAARILLRRENLISIGNTALFE